MRSQHRLRTPLTATLVALVLVAAGTACSSDSSEVSGSRDHAGSSTAPDRAGAGGFADEKGFADASSTGVPAGTKLRPSGDLTVSTAGTVVDGLDVRGTIQVEADNVTIRRTRIRGDDIYVIRIDQHARGTVIEDVEIDGSSLRGVNGIYGPFKRVSRVNIHHVENGVTPAFRGNSLIEDSYIHDLAGAADAHFDGVQIDGGLHDITIRRNTIVVPAQTAAVMIDNYWGPVSNIVITGNRLSGGSYCIYSDGGFRPDPITGVRITDNRLGGWTWGPWAFKNNDPARSGNVHDVTGERID
jgi:hypothetical protein